MQCVREGYQLVVHNDGVGPREYEQFVPRGRRYRSTASVRRPGLLLGRLDVRGYWRNERTERACGELSADGGHVRRKVDSRHVPYGMRKCLLSARAIALLA